MAKSKKTKKKNAAPAEDIQVNEVAVLERADEAAVEGADDKASDLDVESELLASESMESDDESESEDLTAEASESLDEGDLNLQAQDEKNVFEEMMEAAEASEGSEESTEGAELEGSELDSFESAAIEDLEFVEDERLESILEAMLFASDRPISFATFKMTFKGTNIRGEHIRRSLERLSTEYAGGRRGISLEEVPGGYQLRTKLDNMKFLTRTLKVRPFKVSGPALEVLSIVAYKQPVIKSEIDDIRGVESGHLLRALMEKGLVQFEGKSDFPGRPMLYGTSKKFLEIFGLRNLKELPTLSQIDELLPDGIGDEFEGEKTKLADVTDQLSQNIGNSYSDGEDELMKISETLQDIDVSSEFFEKEKLKQRESRDAEKAANLREALMVGEQIPTRDRNWLERYDEALAGGTSLAAIALAKDKARLSNIKTKTSGDNEANSEGQTNSEGAAAEATEDGESSTEASMAAAGESEESDEQESISGELSALSSSAIDDFENDSEDELEEEVQAARFEEEEDISLDQDLNVPFHDEEGPDGQV